MTHSYVWHDSFICVTWLIHMCDMTHSYVWHDSFICVTHSYVWLIHVCQVQRAAALWTCHTNQWVMFVIQVPFLYSYGTWRVPYERVMSHVNESCQSRGRDNVYEESCHVGINHVTMNDSCQIRMSHVTYESVISHMNESCYTRELVMSHIWMSHVT